MTQGLDYAWGWPIGPASFIRAIKAGGYSFVFRYLSTDPGKNLRHAEAQALSDAGISIGVVWETSATRAGDGYGAGRDDAKAAELQAEACGMPSDRPIYFAVDYDAAGSDVEQYFHGVASVLTPARSGVYGGYRVVKHLLDLGLVRWAWQASAWSYGQWDSRAHVRQHEQRFVGGVDCDVNQAMKDDFGQWRVGQSPQQQPAQQEEDMQFGELKEGAQAITPISVPRGKYSAIGFTVDNGLAGKGPAKLRVALHLGGGNWQIHQLEADSAKDKPAIVFDAKTQPLVDGISVRREDAGDVAVAYDLS